jgi:hypothetical protein
MIDKFEDLDIGDTDEMPQVEQKVQYKLGIAVSEMKAALANYVQGHAEELSLEFVNIAPLGDYGKLLEDNDSMAEFLKSEGFKSEHWELRGIRMSDVQKNLLSFEFANKSVDDGEVFQGFVYVSFQGKIKHAFAQGCDN